MLMKTRENKISTSERTSARRLNNLNYLKEKKKRQKIEQRNNCIGLEKRFFLFFFFFVHFM